MHIEGCVRTRVKLMQSTFVTQVWPVWNDMALALLSSQSSGLQYWIDWLHAELAPSYRGGCPRPHAWKGVDCGQIDPDTYIWSRKDCPGGRKDCHVDGVHTCDTDHSCIGL